MNKIFTPTLLALYLLLANPLHAADEQGHDRVEKDAGHTDEQPHADEHEEESGVQLNAAQRLSAGIEVQVLTPQSITKEVEAPGEIMLNRYATRQVTPRIEAQVIARHARLGDKVHSGQSLVSLSSVSMSEAQGTMLSAENEWQRVRKLGRKVVAARRFQDARIAAQQARARLLAYGMTEAQVDQLASSSRIDQADGRFDLLSPIAGTVIRDDFIVGQMVQPGDVLFEISDESRLWVEARLEAALVHQVKVGSPAQVQVEGRWISGEVIQVHHALDETTRTLAVRIAIPNPDDRLHPGQFVSVRIDTGDSGEQGMLLPQAAVLRGADGDWQVFVEHEPGAFEPLEVEVVRQLGDQLLVEGIAPGSRVVTQGAFFVQSELAKSGFAVHNH